MGAGRNTDVVHLERIAVQRQCVGVKAVGTLAVVSIKFSSQIARTNNQSSVQAEDELTEEDIDAISGVIVETFGGKFSINDLDKGCDVDEVLAVFNNIVARAQSVRPNGLPPA